MRLTTDIVEKAFEATGLKPVRKTFGDGSVGCGMQAVALERGLFYNSIREMTGRPYFEGFTRGWDGYAPLDVNTATKTHGVHGMFENADGYADGKAAAARMIDGVRTDVRSEELVTA